MNKARRDEIAGAIVQLEAIREQAYALAEEIARIRDEEQDYFDNMPEAFQNAERGDLAQEAIDALDNAVNEIEGLLAFDGLVDYLESAAA